MAPDIIALAAIVGRLWAPQRSFINHFHLPVRFTYT